MKVRTRFAPSPTGVPHIGVLRTALFCWLYAKSEGGDFILRFEDTDRQRFVPESVEKIQDSLDWLGMNWDEGPDVGGDFGPYLQSERLQLYQEYARALLDQGRIYRDWTSAEKLGQLREQAKERGNAFIAREELLDTTGHPEQDHVLRFKIDTDYHPEWQDSVFGKQSQAGHALEDFVCIKSDGYPTYNFANVVDDHLMDISHVIRGEEFIASTPKHLQLYQAFKWKPPEFAHVPPVLGPDGSKLSKRHGAKSALEYRDQGFLPKAVLNYLALLGWNDQTDQEIYSAEELIESFSLGRIQKSPATFDQDKLEWLNGVYIRESNFTDLYRAATDFWPEAAADFDKDYRKRVLELVQERLKHLGELGELTEYFFREPNLSREGLTEFADAKPAKAMLEETITTLETTKFSEEELEDNLRALVDDLNVKTGTLFQLIRYSVTGTDVSPGLFETLSTLGKQQTVERLQTATEKLSH